MTGNTARGGVEMNCTERDARCKICPITMSSMGVKTCVGSACMAWKWNEHCRRELYFSRFYKNNLTAKVENWPIIPEPDKRPDDVPSSYQWRQMCDVHEKYVDYAYVEPVEEFDKRRTGYCGMTNVGDEFCNKHVMIGIGGD